MTQPRLDLTVPSCGIGPLTDPNKSDALYGRGKRIDGHVRNVQFRENIKYQVHKVRSGYLDPTIYTKRLEKAHIAAETVCGKCAMYPAGSFLKLNNGTGIWFDIGNDKVITKTGQDLREGAPAPTTASNIVDSGSSVELKKTITTTMTAAATASNIVHSTTKNVVLLCHHYQRPVQSKRLICLVVGKKITTYHSTVWISSLLVLLSTIVGIRSGNATTTTTTTTRKRCPLHGAVISFAIY